MMNPNIAADKVNLEEMRQQLKAVEAMQEVVQKHEGRGAIKADYDYVAQRKSATKAVISSLEKKINEAWEADRKELLAGILTHDQAVGLLEKHGHLPLRILLKASEDGRYQGEVEHSFSLSWTYNKVGIYWSGTAYSFLGSIQLDAIKNAEGNAKRRDDSESIIVCDPLSPECPVEVDILTWTKAFMGGSKVHKFDKRNAPMTQKGGDELHIGASQRPH